MSEYIGHKGEPGELKHLSTGGKDINEIPLVVASEHGPGQCFKSFNWNRLENRAIVGDSPVRIRRLEDTSRAGHVKSCLNMGRPLSKPKYSSATDSEQVP